MSPMLPVCFWRWELPLLKNSCCHERVNSWEGSADLTEEKQPELSSCIHNIYSLCASKNQSQFKSNGNKLTPDCPNELALMYQRMFEGFTLTQKTGMSTKLGAFHKKISVLATCWHVEFHAWQHPALLWDARPPLWRLGDALVYTVKSWQHVSSICGAPLAEDHMLSCGVKVTRRSRILEGGWKE